MEKTYSSLRKHIMLNPQQLQPTSRDLDANNTSLHLRGDNVAVKLHKTDVVTYLPDGSIVLDSGGWRTVTTKDRMNRYLPRGIFVRQENNVWYVHNRNNDQKPVVFEDGMVIAPDGSLPDVDSDKDEQIRDKASQIKTYAKKFVDEFVKGNIPEPSSGDCWYCSMKVKDTGETLGDALVANPPAHLESHLEEEYFVPSLLANAVRDAMDKGHAPRVVGNLMHQVWVEKANEQEIKNSWGYKVSKPYVQKAIEDYFRVRYGMPRSRTTF